MILIEFLFSQVHRLQREPLGQQLKWRQRLPILRLKGKCHFFGMVNILPSIHPINLLLSFYPNTTTLSNRMNCTTHCQILSTAENVDLI
jgi:hypothetical protein